MLNNDTKNKMADIIKKAQEEANNKKSFLNNPTPAPAAKKPVIVKPAPIQAVIKPEEAKQTPNTELSNITSADLLGSFNVNAAEVKETTTPANNIQIVDYSEKAFAVIGDTKPIKEKLGAAGGRFNYNLKCGAGWIFSKKRLTEVKQLLNIAA